MYTKSKTLIRKALYGLLTLGIALAVLGAGNLFTASAQVASTGTPTPKILQAGSLGVTVGEPVMPREFTGDVRALPSIKPTNRDHVHPVLLTNSGQQKQPIVNPGQVSVQPSASVQNMPGPNVNFIGLDYNNWGDGWPPDPNGDVGPNHYIQAVNTSVGIFSKTGTRLAAFTYNSLWSTAGSGTPCDNSNDGDPVVLYDPIGNRWIITDMAWTNIQSGPYYECLAVSKTSDPVAGGWWLYAFRTDDANHPWLMDYPKLAIWPDGIYMSANMFDCLNSTCKNGLFKGVRVWALNRTLMENGTSATSVHFDTSTAYFSLLPSNLRGSLPPTGTPNYFVSNAQSVYGLDVWKLHVDWATPGNSTFIGPTVVAISSYTSPPSTIPQPAGDALDSLGDRLMMQNQYRNISGAESLWITHTVGSGGVTGPRWYQLNVSGGTIATSPIQFNTYQPDSTYRWMSSLAVDKAGDMALGFSVSSTNLDPGIRYTGRLAGDPLNTLPQGEMTLIAGTGYQNGGFGRWGDYSAMTVDSVDDCTFWYTNEYYTTNGNNWQTRIGSFTFPSCTSNATLTPTPTATLTSTPTNTQTPTTTFTPTQTNTKTPTATFTSTPTNTQTPTTTFTPTQTNTKTPTATFTSTASNTSSPTATFTSTPSYTLTPTATFTFTPSYTPTLTTTINYKIWLPIIFK